jgi:hypothetical protein
MYISYNTDFNNEDFFSKNKILFINKNLFSTQLAVSFLHFG